MTVIRPNSISGVSSITTNGGDLSLFRSDGTTSDIIVNNVTSGIITAAGDIGCQKIIEQNENFNYKRFFMFSGLGMVLWYLTRLRVQVGSSITVQYTVRIIV